MQYIVVQNVVHVVYVVIMHFMHIVIICFVVYGININVNYVHVVNMTGACVAMIMKMNMMMRLLMTIQK